MKKILSILLFLLPIITSAQMKQIVYDAQVGNGMQIDAAGHRESAVVFLPETYVADGKTKWPVFLSFHGAGEASQKMVYAQLLANGLPKNIIQGVKLQAIVIAIQDQWSTPAPAQVDYAFRNTVLKQYQVDTTRIYTTGYSYGGMGALAMAISNPYISAVVSLSPSPLQDSSVKKIPALVKNNIPVAWWYQPNDPGTPSQADVTQYNSALIASGGSSVAVIGTPIGQHGPWDGVYTGKVLFSGKTFDNWSYQYSKTPLVITIPPVTPPTRNLLYTIKVYDSGQPEIIPAQ